MFTNSLRSLPKKTLCVEPKSLCTTSIPLNIIYSNDKHNVITPIMVTLWIVAIIIIEAVMVTMSAGDIHDPMARYYTKPVFTNPIFQTGFPQIRFTKLSFLTQNLQLQMSALCLCSQECTVAMHTCMSHSRGHCDMNTHPTLLHNQSCWHNLHSYGTPTTKLLFSVSKNMNT